MEEKSKSKPQLKKDEETRGETERRRARLHLLNLRSRLASADLMFITLMFL